MTLLDWSQVAEEQVDSLTLRQMVATDTMTIIRRQLRRGASLHLHKHVEEQITMVETGKLLFVIEGDEQVVNRGQMLVIQSNSVHSVEALEDSVTTDVFPLLRADQS